MQAVLILFVLIETSVIQLAGQIPDHEIAIRSQNVKFSRLVVHEKLDSLMLLYHNDAKVLPRHSEIISGIDNIRDLWQLSEGDTTSFHKIYPQEIILNGTTAYDYGYYEVSGKRGKRIFTNFRGKYVVVWKKDQYGAWRILLDIWNYVQ